ncbi:MAG: hypothetical protein WDO69_11650 [Pseudomonadota bacterium]
MGRPNLFSFATSELSQDAFLCWLAALADHDDADLQQLGQSFIAWLWQQARGASVEPNRVRLLRSPERQVDHVDILFEAEIAGTRALFLIEDKTETSHHSGQLERYLKAVSHAEVVPVYFKTGYHFGTDTAATAAGYTVVGLDEWVAFLKAQTARSDIFDDYSTYVAGLHAKRSEALSVLLTPEGYKRFDEDFVQYEFMRRVANSCSSFIGRRSTYRGRSLGGKPWTQHLFAEFEHALPTRLKESLFYRLDRRTGGWYLAIRQYAKVQAADAARAVKLARLAEYRRQFDCVLSIIEGRPVFKQPSTDRQGKNESEVAVLFFDDATNTTSRVLEALPRIHEAFLSAIRASRG